MSVDGVIGRLAFSESRSVGEAMVNIAQHRAELSNAVADAKGADPQAADAKTDEFRQALQALIAARESKPAPALDKTA